MSKNSIIDQQEDDRYFGTNTRRVMFIMTSVLEDKINQNMRELWMNPNTYGIIHIKPRQIASFIPSYPHFNIDKYGKKNEVPINNQGQEGRSMDGL